MSRTGLSDMVAAWHTESAICQPVHMTRFVMARCRATRLLWPLVRGEQHAEIADGVVRLRYGALGGFEVPVDTVDRLSTMRWPWWSGLGVRLGVRLVSFVGRPGQIALLELDAPINVRAPIRWKTPRIAVGVEDVDGFLRAIAHERARVAAEGGRSDP